MRAGWRWGPPRVLQGVGTSLRGGTGEGVPGRGISVEPEGFLGGRQAEKPAAGYLQGESGRCNRFEMGEGTRSAGKVREAQGSCRGGVGMRLGPQHRPGSHGASWEELGFYAGSQGQMLSGRGPEIQIKTVTTTKLY